MKHCSQLLDPLALTPDEHRSWRALADNAATSNAFLDPSFVVPAARHLPGGSAARLLVIGGNHESWSAMAVVVPGAPWRRLPLRALGTWSHDQQGLGTPLLDGDDPDGAATALIAGVGDVAPRATLLGLDEQAGDDRAQQALSAALDAAGWRRTRWRCTQRAVLVREPPFDLLLTESARLRTKRRRLHRIAGAVHVRDCSGPAEAEFGAATLLQLEAAGWKGEAGTAMSQRPGEGAMLTEVVQKAAAHGLLRCAVLMAGERAVAVQVDLVSGDTWFHWKTAYDPEYAACSPGRLLLTHVLERFDAEGLYRWDACTAPDHPVMNALLPHTRTIVELAATRGPAATSIVRAARVVNRYRDRNPR